MSFVGHLEKSCIAVVAALSGTGCLYLDPINLPPNASVALVSDGPYWRGDRVELSAVDALDVDGTIASTVWQVRACDGDGKCEIVPDLTFYDKQNVAFDIPLDVVPGVAVEVIDIDLTVFDQLGARDLQSVRIDVGNRAPMVELQLQNVPGGVSVGGTFPFAGADNPALIIARVTDSDDPEGVSVLEWQLVGVPPESAFADVGFAQYPDAVDPTYTIVPDVVGLYTVRVTATDALGSMSTEDVDIVFTGETPPCIAVTQPEAQTAIPYVVAGDGIATLAVIKVDDDLDAFPGSGLGVTEFAWFVEPPEGGGFASVGTDESWLSVDGFDYGPGDELRVRVEIFDREQALVACPDSDDTCSSIGTECVQRVTWRVRVQ